MLNKLYSINIYDLFFFVVILMCRHKSVIHDRSNCSCSPDMVKIENCAVVLTVSECMCYLVLYYYFWMVRRLLDRLQLGFDVVESKIQWLEKKKQNIIIKIMFSCLYSGRVILFSSSIGYKTEIEKFSWTGEELGWNGKGLWRWRNLKRSGEM